MRIDDIKVGEHYCWRAGRGSNTPSMQLRGKRVRVVRKGIVDVPRFPDMRGRNHPKVPASGVMLQFVDEETGTDLAEPPFGARSREVHFTWALRCVLLRARIEKSARERQRWAEKRTARQPVLDRLALHGLGPINFNLRWSMVERIADALDLLAAKEAVEGAAEE